MDKKKRTVCILLTVIAVLAVCYLGLCAYNKNREEAQERAAEESKIYMTDVENVSMLRYDIGNGEMAFEFVDGVWYVQSDPDFPLTQTYVQAIASEYGKLAAERELEDADALADYGLDEPAYWVELTDEDGEVTLIRIGNAATSSYESFYATVNEDGSVYTIASTALDYLDYTLEDMAQLDIMPTIGSGNLVKETITVDGESRVYDSENEEDEEAIAAAAGGLGAVSLDTVADYSVADEDLAEYGLDEASRTTVEVIYTENDETVTRIIYIGAETEEDTTYFMLGDSRIVYEVTTEVCRNILNQ